VTDKIIFPSSVVDPEPNPPDPKLFAEVEPDLDPKFFIHSFVKLSNFSYQPISLKMDF
jgi:hypothetical protein